MRDIKVGSTVFDADQQALRFVAGSGITLAGDFDDRTDTVSVTITGGGGAVAVPTVADGRWFMPWGQPRGATVTPSEAQLWFTHMPFPKSGTLTGIGVHVQTNATAGGLLRLGLYSSTGGVPDSLLVDAGTVDVTTTGFKSLSISLAVTPSYGFFGCAWQGGPGTRAGVNGGSGNTFIVPGLSTSSPDGNLSAAFFQNSVSGSLPSSATPVESATSWPNHFYLKY